MRILVVEDIEQQADWLCEKLRESYHPAELQWVRTESEFHARVEEFRKNPPDLAIIDMMLAWSDPMLEVPDAPSDVTDDGRRAGLRCIRLLRADPRSAKIRIIIRTVLEDIDFDEGEVPDDVPLVTKESDSEGLFQVIRKALTEHAEENRKPAPRLR